MANRLVRLMAAAVALGALPTTATAAMELYFSDPSGDAHQVEILAGESFDIQVGYATTEVSTGLSYWLNISDAGSGKFAITNRTFPADGVFLDLITSNTMALASTAALLDPRNDKDLGAVNADPTVPEPAGLYIIATLTITAVSDVAPGTYTLSGWNCVGTNPSFESIPITVHDYTIVVTDGSGGSDTGEDTTDTNDGTGTTDGGTTDTGTTDTNTDGQTTNDTQGTDSGTETTPTAVTSRCGTGISGITAVATLLGLWLVRPSRRSA